MNLLIELQTIKARKEAELLTIDPQLIDYAILDQEIEDVSSAIRHVDDLARLTLICMTTTSESIYDLIMEVL